MLFFVYLYDLYMWSFVLFILFIYSYLCTLVLFLYLCLFFSVLSVVLFYSL